jgi:hypothetical protein
MWNKLLELNGYSYEINIPLFGCTPFLRIVIPVGITIPLNRGMRGIAILKE